MNKLSVLYTLFKNTKDVTDKKGQFKLEALLDSEVKMSGQANLNCANGKIEKQLDLQCGEEKYHFEHQGSSENKECCSGFHQHMMHKHHGNCGHKGKVAKMMFALKMLDLLELKEDNAQKHLSLNVKFSDLPQELQAHLKEKKAMCCTHSENSEQSKFHKLFNKECCELDHSTIMPETATVNMVLDSDCRPQSLNINLQMEGQTPEGVSKTIEIKLDGVFNY